MTRNIRQYAAKQGIITGICTLILCVVLFFFMVKTGMPLSAIFIDLSLTVGCTGFICGLIQVLTVKGAVKKGAVPPVGDLGLQAAYVLVPKNGFAFLVVATVAEVLLFAFAPIGIISMVLAAGGEVPRFGYIVLKSFMAAFAGGYATYHANIFVCGLHQEKLIGAAK